MTGRIADLTPFTEREVQGYRLINAKFPPTHLFDDVANSDDFEALYAFQALTNPRLQTEIGNLSLLAPGDIPFGIRGCQYAAASFTHVNPDGSRFSDGSYGVMYIGDTSQTSLAEVMHHQNNYWKNVHDLHYDRFVFKEIICCFGVSDGLDATALERSDPIYASDDYGISRQLGMSIIKSSSATTLKYASVRNVGSECFALFTPKEMTDIVQSKHYEMIWDGVKIVSVNIVTES